jgi:hypothetical protein
MATWERASGSVAATVAARGESRILIEVQIVREAYG